MAREWTPEQIKALETTDRTVLLSAAAGSGKTATLTERLIRMITDKDNPLDVSRMVVVTFTRAAAAELRERIAAALDDALAKDPENKHLLRSSLLLPSATIRTIDSFCNDLVRGNAESLGLAPHYRIADPAEKKLLMNTLFDDLITDAFDGTYRAEGLDIAYLTECATDARTEKELVNILRELYIDLEGYPDGKDILRQSLEKQTQAASLSFFETDWGKAIRQKAHQTLSFYADALHTARENALLEGDAVFLKTLNKLIEKYEAVARGAVEAVEKGYTAAKLFLADISLPSLRSSNDLAEDARLAKLLAVRFADTVKKLYARFFMWEEKDIPYAAKQSARLTRTVLLLLEEFERRFDAEKRRAGICTYADLEHDAYRLLYHPDGSTTPLAKELRDSYDAICIDEYQDVNDLQHLIFEAISKPTNRFMVGDIKQSIYAFRGAKPAIFAKLRASLPAYEENRESTVLYLTKNFRSYGHLIDFNNAVFDFLFGKIGESIGYRKEDALQTGRKPPASPLPLPELYYAHIPKGTDDKTSEWDIVAQKIKAVLAENKTDSGKPLLPSDIAVLYRSGTDKPAEIAASLRAHGLPVCTKDTQNFFENPEILLALCLLHTVNNPRRDIYLAGLLRSPLYRFTMDELVDIRSQKSATLYDSLLEYTESHSDFEKGKRFLSDLSRFRAVSEGERADRLCRFLWEETGLYSVTDTQGKNRLHTLYDCARTYENGSFHGLYRFLSYLNEIYENGANLGSERMLGDKDGIKIMTMHASKGLEFPVCFISDTLPYEPTNKPKLLFHPALGIALPIKDPFELALLENPFFTALETRSEEENLEEEIRVLYVALTRASEQMYITARHNTGIDKVKSAADLLCAFPSRTLLSETYFLHWVLAAIMHKPHLASYRLGTNTDLAALLGEGEKTEEGKEEVSKEAEKEASSAAFSEEDIERLRAMYQERFSFVYPHAAESKLPGKVSVSKLYPAYLDEDTLTERAADAFTATVGEAPKKTVPFFLSGMEENAAAKAGIATHLFLQFCDFSALTGKGTDAVRLAVERELARLVSQGFLHPSDADRVRIDELVAFAASDLLQEILNAKEVRREFRFNTYLPAELFSESEKESYRGLSVFTQGVIDVLIETAEGDIILADYKTDRLTPPMLANRALAEELLLSRHATQLTYYALAIEKIFGKKPKSVKIYSLHKGESFLLPLA